MNLERTKPETLAAAALDLTPSQSLAAHEYAERLNAALARLGLTDRLTLPPAPNTAIDELPGVVDVPLRKTLSVLMGKAQQGDASALATLEWTAQVAESIFAGLHARASVYPLALPSHESLATLAQGVDALLPRKISNGAWSLLADGTPSDGIDDGVSLVRLLCSSAADSVTELKDDNEGWVMTKNPFTILPNIKKWVCGAKSIKFYNQATNHLMFNGTEVEELSMPLLEEIAITTQYDNASYGRIFSFPKLKGVSLPNLRQTTGCLFEGGSLPEELELPNLEVATRGVACGVSGVKRIICPKLRECSGYSYNSQLIARCEDLEYAYIPNLSAYTVYGSGDGAGSLQDMPKLSHLVIGKAPFTSTSTYVRFALDGCPNLVLLDIRGGLNQNIYLDHWNPTSVLSDSGKRSEFLSNFKTYIAERLSEQGSGLTLTLSQAVRDAIEGDPTIAQIITSKGWTISPAPSV